ncbi:MAG TPA: hypothetical protein VGN20_14095 [Mucilaginibacter sp.]|jgi:hypothetical protein
MAEYALDKYEFKKYLLDELADTRQEELIFWKNTIPMPVDLIYNIFDKRGTLFRTYLDHIGAAYLFAWSERQEGKDWKASFILQPTAANTAQKATLIETFTKHFDEAQTGELLAGLSELFLLENYRTGAEALVQAICHEGRKYKRLYIPVPVRQKLQEAFPDLLDYMSLSNWDMFSNVIADELKVYRMGFADAFNSIFIKLIEFVLRYSGTAQKKYVSATGFDLRQKKTDSGNENEVIYGNVSDGSIWEPAYASGKTYAVMNKLHPYCDELQKNGTEAEHMLGELLNVMAEKENEMLRDRDKKVIEIFRQDVSRELRIRAEKKS